MLFGQLRLTQLELYLAQVTSCGHRYNLPVKSIELNKIHTLFSSIILYLFYKVNTFPREVLLVTRVFSALSLIHRAWTALQDLIWLAVIRILLALAGISQHF